MKIQQSILALTILLFSLPAHAIPPPEMVVSIWQSLLQFLGVASVFVGAAILSMRQFFGMYIVGWKRVVFYLSLLVILVWGLWFLFGGKMANAKPAQTIQGELVPVHELIERDKDDWVREWKLKTVEEMLNELNIARASRGLPEQSFDIVQSYSPKRLSQLVKTQKDRVYILDIREEYEQSRFGIEINGSARYGDIAGNIIPPDLPKNMMIVVLCHSGLRGYFGANLLKSAGYSQVAFLQGGLAAWKKQGLPVKGDPEYSAQKRWLPNLKETLKLSAVKIQVDADGHDLVKGIPGLIRLPYETATAKDIEKVMLVAQDLPILLVCNTYGGCFHSSNMAWLIEKKGGDVSGIYDHTGEHIEGFFD